MRERDGPKYALFSHPYTKIAFVERDLRVSRLTATRSLEALTAGGVLSKQKVGRSNYYINTALYAILTEDGGGHPSLLARKPR